MLTRPYSSQVRHGATSTVEVELDMRRSLASFGAVGDGVADDSSALIAALAAGTALRAEPGATYKVTQLLDMASGTHLDLTGATIDASALPVQNPSHTRVIRSHGTYGTPVNITVNAARGDFTVTAANTGLVDGDMVMVFSQKLFDSANTSTKEGEIAIVRSADATTVTLQTPLVAAYAVADTAQIVKLTPRENMSITGGIIIGPTLPNSQTNVHIVDFRATRNVIVKDTIFKDVGASCLRFCDSIFAKVMNCSFEGSAENGHLAYGVSFGNASQDCVALGNSCYNRRHFLTTTNQSTDIGQTGITRRIKFQSNVMYRCAMFQAGSFGDAIDTHGGCEDIEILDNTIHYSTGTGINFEGKSAVIRGNTIYFTDGYGIRVHNETDNVGSVTVNDNKILGGSTGGILIEEGFRGASKGYTTVECCDNNILISAAVVGITVFVDVTALSRPQLTVNGNNVQAGGVAMTIAFGRNGTVAGNTLRGTTAITLSGQPNNVTVSGNSLEYTDVAGRGIDARAPSRCAFTGNVVRMPAGAGSAAIGLFQDSGVGGSDNIVSGNVAQSPDASGLGFFQANNFDYTVITSNNFRGIGTPITAGTGTGHVMQNNIS